MCVARELIITVSYEKTDWRARNNLEPISPARAHILVRKRFRTVFLHPSLVVLLPHCLVGQVFCVTIVVGRHKKKIERLHINKRIVRENNKHNTTTPHKLNWYVLVRRNLRYGLILDFNFKYLPRVTIVFIYYDNRITLRMYSE